jgi:hypothetical protein
MDVFGSVCVLPCLTMSLRPYSQSSRTQAVVPPPEPLSGLLQASCAAEHTPRLTRYHAIVAGASGQEAIESSWIAT